MLNGGAVTLFWLDKQANLFKNQLMSSRIEMYIRTLKFVDWSSFLEKRDEDVSLTLDFKIEAGFSFSAAIAFRKMSKFKLTNISLGENLDVPEMILKLQGIHINKDIILEKVIMETLDFGLGSDTECYLVSAFFKVSKVDYEQIEKQISEYSDSSKEEVNEHVLSLPVIDYFRVRADIVKNAILNFIEVSNYFCRYVHASYNLYLDKGSEYYRVTQLSESRETAGQFALHPHAVRPELIEKWYKSISKIPEDLRVLLAKGSHYRFLGFFEESYLCYYRLIEMVFKGPHFIPSLTEQIFEINNDKIIGAVKGASHKMLAVFIFKWIKLKRLQYEEYKEDEDLIVALMDFIELRNKLTHSADVSGNAKEMIPFMRWIVFNMLDEVYKIDE